MKALLLLVLIYNLQNVRPFGGSDEESSILMKYPKKSNPIYKHHQKLINSGQVHKREFQEKYKPRNLLKLGLGMKQSLYSAFPAKVDMPQIPSAPDSPLFPLDFDFEHKHRFKKTSYSRYKRSVSNNTDDNLSNVTVGEPEVSKNKTQETVIPKENKETELKAKATVKPKEPIKTENPKDGKKKENVAKEAVKHKDTKVKPKGTGKPTASKHTQKTPKQTIKPKANKLRQKRPKASVSPKNSKVRAKRPQTAVQKQNKLRQNLKSAVKPKQNTRGQSKLRENKPKSNQTAIKTKKEPVRNKKNLRDTKQIGVKTAPKPKTNTVRHKSAVRNVTKISKVRSRRDLVPNRRAQSKKGKNNKRQRSRGSNLRNGQIDKTVGKIGKQRVARSGKKPARTRLRSKDNKTGKGGKDSRRLIASRDVSPEDYPYMVSIQKDREHWCSGAVLNRRLIISTANCFWKSQKVTRLKARIGSRNVDSGGQLCKIQEVMKHPKWNIRGPPDNDVALAVLDRNLKFSHAVHAVDLPNRAMLPPFDDAWVTSFGADRRDGVYMQHNGMTLQMYHARIVDPLKCNNITQRFGVPVSDNFICLSQSGRRSPCTRDTGAPAVSDGILWGLASWGIRKLCGTERYPAMFTYIASGSVLDFILNATSYLMVDERENPMLDRLPRIPGIEAHDEAPED